jgi:hypothetical protein
MSYTSRTSRRPWFDQPKIKLINYY